MIGGENQHVNFDDYQRGNNADIANNRIHLLPQSTEHDGDDSYHHYENENNGYLGDDPHVGDGIQISGSDEEVTVKPIETEKPTPKPTAPSVRILSVLN